jgi:formyl-CoA transferase
VQHGTLGQIEVVNQAVKLSRTPSRMMHPTPEKGEHTEEVLKEYGYDDKAIEGFRTRKIV